MKNKFPYKNEKSALFGLIKRPVALASFWSKKYKRFLEISLIVDTGADYTIFPCSKAIDFGIDLEKECHKFKTLGIGGSEKVFFLPEIKMKIGASERLVPVGFLNRDDIPPLLGRYRCLDTFSVTFNSFTTVFIG